MALILNIDTASETAGVSLGDNGKLLLSAFNDTRGDHAAWIQVAIQKLMAEAGKKISDLDAVGVNIGPGSYTGLRIGLSSAKGICFSLSIPLLTEISLKLLAFSAIADLNNSSVPMDELFFCPMIDARRMEVFAAVYDSNLKEVMSPQAYLLNANSFHDQLERQKILFLGNGSAKFQSICQNFNAIFKKIPLNPLALSELTYKNFIGNNFADLTYTEPLYLKEFFTRV